MRKRPKKLALAVQRTVALCLVVLAACGHPSASDGLSPGAPSITETGKLVLQRCPSTANDGGGAGRVTVLDPFDGRQTLPIDSFWTGFSKVALLFE